jgi:hypothetical protein
MRRETERFKEHKDGEKPPCFCCSADSIAWISSVEDKEAKRICGSCVKMLALTLATEGGSTLYEVQWDPSFGETIHKETVR